MECMTTKQIAERVGKSEQYVRRVMAKLERMKLVVRKGERGGWMLSAQPPISLHKRDGGPDENPSGRNQEP